MPDIRRHRRHTAGNVCHMRKKRLTVKVVKFLSTVKRLESDSRMTRQTTIATAAGSAAVSTTDRDGHTACGVPGRKDDKLDKKVFLQDGKEIGNLAAVRQNKLKRRACRKKHALFIHFTAGNVMFFNKTEIFC